LPGRIERSNKNPGKIYLASVSTIETGTFIIPI
jgi:hypothetical protein